MVRIYTDHEHLLYVFATLLLQPNLPVCAGKGMPVGPPSIASISSSSTQSREKRFHGSAHEVVLETSTSGCAFRNSSGIVLSRGI